VGSRDPDRRGGRVSVQSEGTCGNFQRKKERGEKPCLLMSKGGHSDVSERRYKTSRGRGGSGVYDK